MILKNLNYLADDFTMRHGSIATDGTLFSFEEEADAFECFDLSGFFAIPGLIDIHFHGAVNADVRDGCATSLEKLAVFEAFSGVTAICPATVTADREALVKMMESVSEYCDRHAEKTGIQNCEPGEENAVAHDRCAEFLGVHLEGPFFNPSMKGAQQGELMRPCDLQLSHELQEISGNRIRYVDVAPETEGALPFIRSVRDSVIVSLAHSAADYDTATEAFQAGASHVTHLYNAMKECCHRAPGIPGAAADAESCSVELIADGIHNHPSIVRNAYRIFGEDRVILVSDSMRATGLSDGIYASGGPPVYVKDRRATLSDGTLAGSASTLMDCVRTAVTKMRIPLSSAVKSASKNPAKELGVYDSLGSITPGKHANLVILDSEWHVKGVLLKGKFIRKEF
jgi:N-acetylglucosamine-6-phosphate deacetylase